MNSTRNSDVALSIASEFIYGNDLPSRLAKCRRCDLDVPFLTPDIAASLDWTTVEEIFRRVEERDLHFRFSMAGTVEICQPRLSARREETTTKRYPPSKG